MTGIIKTDQLQGAQGSSVTVPTGHTCAVTSNATVGGTLSVTGDVTATNTSGNRILGIICLEKGLSKNTKIAYTKDISLVFEWFENKNILTMY